MNKMLVVLAAASAAAVSVPALADVDEGRISEIKGWAISLDRGHQFFTVADREAVKGFNPGDRVRVTFAQDPEGEKKLVKLEKLSNQ